jgi:integrase
MAGYKIRENTTQPLDGFVKALKTNDGPSAAKSARVILSGMFGLAYASERPLRNPVRDVGTIKMESRATRTLSADELRRILDAMRASQIVLNPANKVTPHQTLSQYCAAADLSDVVTMFAATGARISEVLGIRRKDIDFTAKTVTISGSFAYTGSPLPCSWAARYPRWAIFHDVVFPSALGTLRDPSAVHKQWRTVRACLKLDWVTSRTFRRTMATLLDTQGLSARIGDDQLGHAQVSMTMTSTWAAKQSIPWWQTCRRLN